MRISDWSSDVCSSDLPPCRRLSLRHVPEVDRWTISWFGLRRHPENRRYRVPRRLPVVGMGRAILLQAMRNPADLSPDRDRKSVVEGKSVSVRVELGGRRLIKKKKENTRLRKEA